MSDPLFQHLKRDGFVMLPGFYPAEIAERARREIQAWYDLDLAERQQRGITQPRHDGVAGATILTRPTHLMLDVYGRSPALDAMLEQFLGHPTTRDLLAAVAGPRIKLRGFNVRLMTGAVDPPPAHEWHRDSPGEIGIGILLTDVPPGEHGGTALLPGSHLYPYDPRPNTLLPGPYKGLGLFRTLNPFARHLAARVLGAASGATGRCGDAYLFVNDTWHGRQPNLHGARSMVALIGAFPTEFPYPDEVAMPPDAVCAALPPRVAEAVRQDQAPNPDRGAYVYEMLDVRARSPEPLVFRLARFERMGADLVSRLVLPSVDRLHAVLRWIARKARAMGVLDSRSHG